MKLAFHIISVWFLIHSCVLLFIESVFQAVSQNRAKLLLASSCLPVRGEELGSHWTDFHEIVYFRISRKPVEEI